VIETRYCSIQKTTTMKKSIGILLLTFLVVSCTGKNEPSEEEKAVHAEREYKEALAAIEEANKMINILVREGKFEEAGEYFATDVVQMISGQPPVLGRDAWIQSQREMAAMGDWNLDLEVLDFEFFGDQAVERGRGVQSFTANEDSPIPSMDLIGDYLVFWKKTPEGWQIQYDYVVVAPPEIPEE
jgi:ketosteroid isomerase-like protein